MLSREELYYKVYSESKLDDNTIADILYKYFVLGFDIKKLNKMYLSNMDDEDIISSIIYLSGSDLNSSAKYSNKLTYEEIEYYSTVLRKDFLTIKNFYEIKKEYYEDDNEDYFEDEDESEELFENEDNYNSDKYVDDYEQDITKEYKDNTNKKMRFKDRIISKFDDRKFLIIFILGLSYFIWAVYTMISFYYNNTNGLNIGYNELMFFSSIYAVWKYFNYTDLRFYFDKIAFIKSIIIFLSIILYISWLLKSFNNIQDGRIGFSEIVCFIVPFVIAFLFKDGSSVD